MASTASIISNPSPLSSSRPLKHLRNLHSQLLFVSRHRRPSLSVRSMASSVSLPVNADYLETEFGGHGVGFEGVGDSCVVKMRLRNGSAATLMLPSGLITSYKPYMWHGATFEVLHTAVTEGENGEAVVQGGVSMDFKIGGDECSIPWIPSSWSLQGVRGSPEKSIQVELVSVSPEKNMAEIKCLVTLDKDCLGSELTVANQKSSALEFSGSFISHLKVSTPDAAYAVGLQGSNYHSKQPVSSQFSIIPPDFTKRRRGSSSTSWTENMLRELMPSWGSTEEVDDEDFETEELEGEEPEDYAPMTEKMSRVYTNAPREFTIIDRGRRNSVVIRRSGFDEFYVLSPGSEHDWYGKYAYLCIGPSAKLTPVRLEAGDVWRGAQYLHNPNL
ncbi:protein NDH-DEPENDENT CYCLIC ELECTRON FLOW 5 [Canna indica]|uniref:Protein NDH-DEPENDENT CYCLIC ELECTRON FLOW 5 n=1 Tax=Canna indica TaxID=4628 RepID=A0AAQ3LBQ8_9LILI|nr:protein NDH-DEPENDENT CYCLIC ELECTRON FLOW 5 [Canna indica]